MGKTVKIAISLPEETLSEVEQERRNRGESRSEFFRQAVQALLRREQRRAAVERYIQGYREQPETQDEVEAAQGSATAALAQEPWEKVSAPASRARRSAR